eukprot:364560-Chlamydomonas_euryale.AAC.9
MSGARRPTAAANPPSKKRATVTVHARCRAVAPLRHQCRSSCSNASSRCPSGGVNAKPAATVANSDSRPAAAEPLCVLRCRLIPLTVMWRSSHAAKLGE